jgi:hydrogenase maturation protein HypF
VITNAEARAALARFADGFILHDRDIRRRLDDSVERITPQGPMILRRGRGRVPGTLPVPPGFEDGPDVLALGGQMKGAICLTKTGQALVSHHLGDLDGRLNVEEFRKAVRDYTALFDHAPGCIAVDLHPGYRATGFGKAMAVETGLPLVPVQHHHAHLAACLGENLWPRDAGPVAGIVLDGLGFGPDGKIWGGEVLVGDYHGFDRLAWIEPAALIGGDAAGRDPWRNHLARLDLAGMQAEADRRYPDAPRDVMRRAVAQGVNAPLSSSAGRLFDAVAAALGVAPLRQTHEAEAAMALEALARADTSGGIDAAYELPLIDGALCTAPLFRALAATSEPPARKAARFHATLAVAFAAIAQGEIRAGRARAVALTGGCFQNALLLDVTCRALGDAPVLLHHMLPANDGGLAFGQALIAAAKPGG